MPPIRTVIKVDPARRAQWLMPSAVRYVNPRHIQYLLPADPKQAWGQGDLLLVEVEGPVGMISSIQNTNRRSHLNYRDAALFPGSKLVAVLAPRAGTSTCIARVPDRPVAELHLHGVGGQVGLIEPRSQHSALYKGVPTTVQVLALLGDEDQRPLNTHRFSLSLPDERRGWMPGDPALILVIGSDMDSGKTTTARRVIYSLRALGHRVVAGKASGVGSLFDIASMFDAGASEVIDFVALGEPVTIGLSTERVLAIFRRVFSYLRGKAGPDGFVVIELADGIWYRETRAILEDELVRSLVTHVVFACQGILDAEHGLNLLQQWGYGDKVRALSGKLGSSRVLCEGVDRLLGAAWPVFDPLDYETSPEAVAALFVPPEEASPSAPEATSNP